MKEKVQTSLTQLVLPDDRLLVAVSGGRDSVTLLHVLHSLHYDFAVAHCNFQLRAEESDEEEIFTEAICRENSIPFYSKKFDTLHFANENKLSIQEAARKLRYDWFNDLAQQFGFDKIATAHHLDDSIETFFINLLRRSGPAGLSGIPVKTNNIIRPFLTISGKEIEAYALANLIRWKNDSSNASDDYLRNRLRHHLIPLLKDDEFENDMQEIMQSFAIIDDYFTRKVEQWIRSQGMEKNILPLDQIREEEYPEEFLSLLLYEAGAGKAECAKILRAETGKKFETKTHFLLIDRGKLLISRKEQILPVSQWIEHLPFNFADGGMNFQFVYSDDIGINSVENVMKVDADLLRLPLFIRRWKDGDRFYPLGMDKPKKVSDFLTDNKVSRYEKEYVCVLLSDNDIVCILGHRIDHRFRITPNTQKTLIITQK